VLFTLDQRPLEALLHQAEANLARDSAQAANAKASADRYQDLAQRGLATKEQLGQTGATVRRARGHGGSRQSRSGKREGAASVRDDPRADRGPYRLAYGDRRQPCARQRSDADGGDQSDRSHLRHIRRAEPMLPDLKRYMAQGALRVEARAPTDSAPPAVGHITFVDNQVDQTTGTIKSSHVSKRQQAALARPVPERRRPAHHHSARVGGAVNGGSNRSAGPVRVRGEGRQDGGLQPVTVDRTAGNETVVKTGIAAGDTVVTDGQLRLLPGSRITIKAAPKKATS
jgi:multidrug efflux system membrane fusion protein